MDTLVYQIDFLWTIYSFSFIFYPVSPQSKASNWGKSTIDTQNQIFYDISTIFPTTWNLVLTIFYKHFGMKIGQRFWGPMDPARAKQGLFDLG